MSTENNDNVIALQLTEQDEADLAKLSDLSGIEDMKATFHPILKVWSEVLKPATQEAQKKVTPQWASRICASYQGLTFADMNEFRDRYFAKIAELRQLLEDEIATDENCLIYSTPEEDVAENSGHYRNILLEWQKIVLGWELDWTCDDGWAEVEMAAIGEVHKMFFGQTGITAFLDNISFVFTDADSAALAAALEEFRGER